MGRERKRRRLVYGVVWILLIGIEVLIALFVHDEVIRPWSGCAGIPGPLCIGTRVFPYWDSDHAASSFFVLCTGGKSAIFSAGFPVALERKRFSPHAAGGHL